MLYSLVTVHKYRHFLPHHSLLSYIYHSKKMPFISKVGVHELQFRDKKPYKYLKFALDSCFWLTRFHKEGRSLKVNWLSFKFILER
jgi:hypothetical protein